MNRIHNNNNNIYQIPTSAKSSGKKRTYFNIQVFFCLFERLFSYIGSVLHGMDPIKQYN